MPETPSASESLGQLTPDALQRWLAAHGEPAYRAAQVLGWLYRRGARSFDAMTDLSRALRERLAADFAIPRLGVIRVDSAGDGTRKLLSRLGDGAAIESVLIPDPPRLTLCVSSQAGCAMGCSFCATARLGLLRDLTADEILGQVLAAQERCAADERLTNVVFMGMGEPLHNYEAVVDAIRVLTARWAFGLSARRITVSTVGLVPAMERLMADTAVQLAVSLVAPTNAQRTRLIPANRKYPIEVLLDACRRLPIPQRRRITFEYVLLAGVNDSPDDATRLIQLLAGMRCKVNLIPFNSFPGSGYAAPAPAAVEAFRAQLDRAHLHATIRASRGREVWAACGQLAGRAAGGSLPPPGTPDDWPEA